MDISTAFRFAFGRVDGADHRRRRLMTIVQGVVTGLANRVVGVAVSLLSVPLTIGYLGPERYGVWTLLGSLLAWARLADLGIGNGLINAIATALGAERPDLVRAEVSTACALFSAVALALGLGIAVAWPWIDWDAVFGVTGDVARAEIRPAVAVALLIFLLGFPLSVIGPVYNAAQDGKLANYWSAAGSVASLLALVLVTQTHGGLVWLVAAVSGTGLAMTAASGLWLFTHRRPAMGPRLRSISGKSVRGLFRIGGQFFLIQIMALVVFETDNLVIAHYLGADKIPAYSLTYSLFGFTSLIQTLLFRYVWVAYTDAIARRDIRWVRRTFTLNLAFSLGSTLAAVAPLILIARPFIKVWAGPAVVPPNELVLWMAAWSMINAFCSPIACLLAAASHMKAQVIYSAVSAVANIALSVYLIKVMGVTGVIAGTVLAYIACVCIPASIDTSILLRKLRNAV